MMGSLVEEIFNNWSYTRNSVLLAKTKLIELDTQLNKLDATSAWKCLQWVTASYETLKEEVKMLWGH